MTENEVAKVVFAAALEIHRAVGPGLLESAYEACLCFELTERGLRVERQVPLILEYKRIRVEAGYRLDLLVEGCVVVELKAIEALAPIHLAQTLTYLRCGNYKLGLLINFNVPLLKDGFRRVVNGL